MAAPVLALLEKDLDDWGSAVLVKASKELGRGAGQNTVYLVVNQQSGVYIMNEALQECEMFDQIYGIGIIEGDILCAEKTAEHAAEGAPVSSSFTLQQRHVFRDKNEAGMQGDIIEDGEERLEVEMDFEDSLRTLRIADGWLAAEDTKSGGGVAFLPGRQLPVRHLLQRRRNRSLQFEQPRGVHAGATSDGHAGEIHEIHRIGGWS